MTKEKNDMTNEHNFKVGDRVAADDAEYSGIVVEVDDMGCKVRFADGEELFFLNDILHHSDLPDYDRRTAFLTRLQSLLREFDAEIYDGEMYYISIDIDANSENRQSINYPLSEMDKYWLDADNIMDFDKE